MKALPNAAIIGVNRYGTTWLGANLRVHPQIATQAKKESHFFDWLENYNKGLDYYQSLFTLTSSTKIILDITPSYLPNVYSTHRIPELIKQDLGDIKMIALLRNPTERIVSQFSHIRAKWPEYRHLSFEEMIKIRPDMIECGLYIDHIEAYLKYFPAELFKFVMFDDIVSKPADVLLEVCEFLGVDTHVEFPLVENKINSAYSKKHEGKNWLLWYSHRLFFKLGMYNLACKFEELNRSPKPTLKPEIQRWLVEEVYLEKNLSLAEFLNVNLDHWNVIRE